MYLLFLSTGSECPLHSHFLLLFYFILNSINVCTGVLPHSPLQLSLTALLVSHSVQYSTLAKAAQVVLMNPLSMALNVVVDTPIGGGIASYCMSF
jgi:hypothetical protein